MADVRATASKYPELKNAVVDSMQQPITLTSALFAQLTLKGELFDVYTGASHTDVEQHVAILDDLIEGRSGSKKELMQKGRMQESSVQTSHARFTSLDASPKQLLKI